MKWETTRTAGHETHGQSAVYDEQTGKTIAIVYDGQAHAAIIAAAPDLLAALKRIVEWIDTGCDPSRASIRNARAAIAKAKGEPCNT